MATLNYASGAGYQPVNRNISDEGAAHGEPGRRRYIVGDINAVGAEGNAEMNGDGAWPHDQTLHAWWVEPGRLLAGEYPGSRTVGTATAKLELLLRAGVDTIVDLTSADDGLSPYVAQLQAIEVMAGRAVNYLSRPIPDMSTLSSSRCDRILDDIQNELEAGRIVYVHCRKGIGRTGTVVGCRLIDSGLDYKTTIARLRELRAGTRKIGVASPQSSAQHHLLLERSRRS